MDKFMIYDAVKEALAIQLPKAIESAIDIKRRYDDAPDYLQIAEAARLLNCSSRYVSNLITNGTLSAVRIAGMKHPRIDKQELIEKCVIRGEGSGRR